MTAQRAAGKSQLRVALVGCGAVARDVHLPTLEDLKGVDVVGLCDVEPERAGALAQRYGVKSFRDPASMLKSLQPDAVHVLTRPESHAELAIQALDAGAHVLVEKPFVYTPVEAERVIETARRCGRRVSVVHNYLHHPSVEDLVQRVGAGEVGEVCSVHFLHGRRDQRYVPDPWYFTTRGGRLGETLPHALYLLASLVPDLEVRYVEASRLGHVQLPDHVSRDDAGPDELRVELSGRGGAHASILYSLNATIAQSLIVAGTKATLQAIIGVGPTVSRWSAKGPDSQELAAMARRWLVSRLERRLRRRTTPRSALDSPHVRQIRAFVTSLREGGDPPVTESQALEVVRLWDAVVSRYDGAAATS